jgi:type IV secretion system protein VirB9
MNPSTVTRALCATLLLSLTSPSLAQAIPRADGDNPRVQSVRWSEEEAILLTLLPDTAMTVVFEPGETIEQAEVADRHAIAARVAAQRNTLQLLPQRRGDLGAIRVTTNQREYRFSARTDTGTRAAYLVEVRFGPVSAPRAEIGPVQADDDGTVWNYRLRGDKVVRPSRIFDDGTRTSIEFPPAMLLPAIFAIGPGGQEQTVDGYMRDDVFVIDRVWSELIFRIDKKKAAARRNDAPERSDG